MYLAWHGLDRDPFALSPDPFFLCPTARHEEALAMLSYGLRQRKGSMVLTGEVGTGKTLLARCLLEQMRRQGTRFSYVFDPGLRPREFWHYVLTDLEIKPEGTGKAARLMALHHFLIARHRLGQTTALIVDEAQILSLAMLEEIRLLTNLETAEHKLLQVVLLGQPEFETLLAQPELRQLRQRISLRSRLEPLTAAETESYVRERMRRAGKVSPPEPLPGPVIQAVHRYAHGLPRFINCLCDQLLLTAYARRQPEVSCAWVDEVAAEMRLTAAPATAAVGG